MGSFEQPYFDANYPSYERQNPLRKLQFYRALAERAAAGIPTPRILDVGCAFGRFLAAVDSRWERFGADVSAYAIDHASRNVPGVTFARADATEIPFAGPFDVMTAFDVIEHVSSLDRVASAVNSKLAAGGHFIFVVPVYDGLTGPIIRFLDKDTTHVHRRSRDFWLQWTRDQFTLVDWWGVLRYLLPGGYYLHLPTHTFRRFTPAIVVMARRKVAEARQAG